jgi:hypothetical protein
MNRQLMKKTTRNAMRGEETLTSSRKRRRL